MISRLMVFGVLGFLGSATFAGDEVDNGVYASNNEYLIVADNRRKDRRDDRQDNRDDEQDCRQEEGRVGDDKRECKQDNRDGSDEDDAGTESDA